MKTIFHFFWGSLKFQVRDQKFRIFATGLGGRKIFLHFAVGVGEGFILRQNRIELVEVDLVVSKGCKKCKETVLRKFLFTFAERCQAFTFIHEIKEPGKQSDQRESKGKGRAAPDCG